MDAGRGAPVGTATAVAAGAALGLAAGVLLCRLEKSSRKGRDGGREHKHRVPLQKLVVIVGMRGAGKTTMGRKAAESLKRRFLDLDEVLEKVLGSSINDFVQKEGWPAFRQAEAKLLEDVVKRGAHGADAAEGCVVACGGGVVETPSAQMLLQAVSPVVFVDRHIEDILKCLEGSGSYRPGLGVPPQEVYARRLPIYQRCCSHIFTMRRGDEDWAALDVEFAAFLCHIEGAPKRTLRFGPDTFIVPVPDSVFQDPSQTPCQLRSLASGADILEVSVVRPVDPRAVLERLALLRRHSYAPVCLAVRAGQPPVDRREIIELARLGIQAGCALVEVEAAYLSSNELAALAAMKGATKLVGSHGAGQKTLVVKAAWPLFRRLAQSGILDLLRVTFEVRDHMEVAEATHMVTRLHKKWPELEVSLAFTGPTSGLGAVTYPGLTTAGCPLSVAEIAGCRSRLGLLDARREFFVFGHPVAMSASPTLQNTGFRVNGAPHVFGRYDAPSLEDVLWKLSLVSTGGGAVTIPHKEGLLEHMDELSEAAREIGAVNTVVKEPGSNRMHGHNTDWMGIRGQLEPKLADKPGGRVGLILGAGGTARAAAYAFKQMGFERVYILNRTVEKAATLASAFGESFKVLQGAKELEALTRLDAVMGTLPGTAGATLPEQLLATCRPVVIDAAYQSSASGKRFTALLQQAADAKCQVVEGLEMLFEQGCAQCELWTGKPAPRREIARALLADRFSGDPQPPQGLVKEVS